MAYKNFRPIRYVEGIKAQKMLSTETYKWRETLQEIQKNVFVNKDTQCNKNKIKVVDVNAFFDPPLARFFFVINPEIKVEVKIYDYDFYCAETNKEVYWIASIKKVCGYMLLLRFEGMEEEGDEKHDFWINIGSSDLKHVGFSAFSNCELIPPEIIRKRQSNWSKYILEKLKFCKTLTSNWPEEQKKSIFKGKIKVDDRLELLDRLESTRIRPAIVVHQLGTRICVKISKNDMLPQQIENLDNSQFEEGVWLDENSHLIFPVGWASYNNYEILCNDRYLSYCKKIAEAIKKGKEPLYKVNSVNFEKLKDWKQSENSNSLHWKIGWKFECLDPLNSSFLELRVATCLELLNDGYIRIGFDGQLMEEESLPIHCTSSFLFPAGYGKQFNISVRGPTDTTEFLWKEYLVQTQSEAAPSNLFDTLPIEDLTKKFPIGAKLEAADLCEPHLICPATVVDIKGRLLRIHFDGWPDDYDQLFDYRSKDIFPLGWCEMYGYRMEPPKTNQNTIPTLKKKKIF